MTWTQNYDPFASPVLSPLVAALPVVLLLGLLASGRVPAPAAALAGLAAAVLAAVFAFTPVEARTPDGPGLVAWAGTMLAALELRAFEHCESETQARKNITAAIETVSRKLGNTPSICRKCYVHPVVIESYLDGSMHSLGQQALPKACASDKHALTPEESSIVALLQQRMTIDAGRATSSTKTGRSRPARQA